MSSSDPPSRPLKPEVKMVDRPSKPLNDASWFAATRQNGRYIKSLPRKIDKPLKPVTCESCFGVFYATRVNGTMVFDKPRCIGYKLRYDVTPSIAKQLGFTSIEDLRLKTDVLRSLGSVTAKMSPALTTPASSYTAVFGTTISRVDADDASHPSSVVPLFFLGLTVRMDSKSVRDEQSALVDRGDLESSRHSRQVERDTVRSVDSYIASCKKHVERQADIARYVGQAISNEFSSRDFLSHYYYTIAVASRVPSVMMSHLSYIKKILSSSD